MFITIEDYLLFCLILVLYKDGPSHYHATYSVVIQVINGSTLTRLDTPINSRLKTWKDLTGLYRITNNVSKVVNNHQFPALY